VFAGAVVAWTAWPVYWPLVSGGELGNASGRIVSGRELVSESLIRLRAISF